MTTIELTNSSGLLSIVELDDLYTSSIMEIVTAYKVPSPPLLPSSPPSSLSNIQMIPLHLTSTSNKFLEKTIKYPNLIRASPPRIQEVCT